MKIYFYDMRIHQWRVFFHLMTIKILLWPVNLIVGVELTIHFFFFLLHVSFSYETTSFSYETFLLWWVQCCFFVWDIILFFTWNMGYLLLWNENLPVKGMSYFACYGNEDFIVIIRKFYCHSLIHPSFPFFNYYMFLFHMKQHHFHMKDFYQDGFSVWFIVWDIIPFFIWNMGIYFYDMRIHQWRVSEFFACIHWFGHVDSSFSL